MSTHETLVRLRNLNHDLIKLSISEIDTGDGEADSARRAVDAARQKLLRAIRVLDPDSCKDPVIEEINVVQFHVATEGQGRLLLEKMSGRTPGGSRN